MFKFAVTFTQLVSSNAETITMRKNIIRATFVVMAITGALLVLGSAKPVSSASPCPESMEQCCKKKNKGGTDNMIRETLSGQFFTFTGFN
jgi:hypothetical protein